MKFENVKSEGMKRDYKVILSAEEIESNITEAVAKRAKTFKMQGFRPGHVPLDIVRKNVEAGVLQEVFDKLISNACSAILKELKLTDMATRPTYKFETNYERGKDVILTISIEAAPDFELKDFKCKITKIIPVVTDKEILEAKKNLIKDNPIFEKAEKDYIIKPGDKVLFYAKCFVNGVESKKKSFENSVVLPIDIPNDAEFLQGFIGKKVKETFEFKPATEKNTIYQFTVKSIKKALLDLPFEEYAMRNGFKTAAELEKHIKDSLETRINEVSFVYHKHQILKKLGEQYSFDLPETVIAQETKNVVANIKKELAREKREGTANEEDLKKTDEDFAKEYESLIRQRVLLGYILNKFAKQYNISANDNEVKDVIMQEVNKNPAYASSIIAHYTGNQSALAYKRAEIVEKKVIEHLISLVEYEEIQQTFEEASKLVDEALDN